MHIPPSVTHNILSQLQQCSATAADFIVSILCNTEFLQEQNLISTRVDTILNALHQNKHTNAATHAWAHHKMMDTYATQLLVLVYQSNDGRASASKATAERLESFDIQGISEEMKCLAPELWEVLGVLLDADPSLTQYRDRKRSEWRARHGKQESGSQRHHEHDADVVMDDRLDVNTTWDSSERVDESGLPHHPLQDEEESSPDLTKQRRVLYSYLRLRSDSDPIPIQTPP
ncbi:hypothetical protein FB446DRAFT_801276 [Lentinula raphanica]|nr:hypothetical protein FB446DRAFT_801276 [Lentinula raphanica]